MKKRAIYKRLQCGCRVIIGYRYKGKVAYNSQHIHYECDICGAIVCETCKKIFEKDQIIRCKKCFMKQLKTTST